MYSANHGILAETAFPDASFAIVAFEKLGNVGIGTLSAGPAIVSVAVLLCADVKSGKNIITANNNAIDAFRLSILFQLH